MMDWAEGGIVFGRNVLLPLQHVVKSPGWILDYLPAQSRPQVCLAPAVCSVQLAYVGWLRILRTSKFWLRMER